MAILIGKSVGKNGVNEPEDVEKIQELLLRTRVVTSLTVNGVCDDQTEDAISEFQDCIGMSSPDSRVDPGGRTLRCMNEVVEPIQFNQITDFGFSMQGKGGYKVSFKVLLPKNYSVKMISGNILQTFGAVPANAFDLTSELVNVCHDKVETYDLEMKTPGSLSLFFEQLSSLETPSSGNFPWSCEIDSQLFLVRNGSDDVVSTSRIKKVRTPVKPFIGNLCLNFARLSPYVAYKKVDAPFLIPISVGDSTGSFFFLGGRFSTEDRALNCTTYVGSLLGLSCRSGYCENGLKILEGLGVQEGTVSTQTATICNVDETTMKTFFQGHKTGSFLLQTRTSSLIEHHLLLVVDGILHEFNVKRDNIPAGYQFCEIEKREWKNGEKYTITEIPEGFREYLCVH